MFAVSRRFSFRAFLALALAGTLLLQAGCGVLQKAIPHRKRRPLPMAPRGPVTVGSVSLVNETSHFVLVDSGNYATPPVGSTLKSFGVAGETGEMVATEVRKRPFIIADIKAGTPKKGDRVMAMPADVSVVNRNTPRDENGTPILRAHEPAPPVPAAVPKRPWWKLWG